MFRAAWYIAVLLTLLLPLKGHAGRPDVMIINSYHSDFPWVASHNAALAAKLGDTVTITRLYLDAKRQSSTVVAENVAAIKDRINADKPDIAVLADDIALREFGRFLHTRDIPVVFLGINNNPRVYLGNLTLATGVLERPLMKRSIIYLKEILGDSLQRCLVLFDNGFTAKTTLDYVFRGRSSNRFGKVETDIKLLNTIEEWKQTVVSAKREGYDTIIVGLYHTLLNEHGEHVPDDQVLAWTSDNSPIPLFGFWDFSIGKGKAAGGFVLAGKPQGALAATLVQRILNGEKPESIEPVTAEAGRLFFSWSELERWGIQLPNHLRSTDQTVRFVE